MNRSVYIFDVDGVLNDIHTYQVDKKVLREICKLLIKGYYVAINTGRGYAWVEEDIIYYLKNELGFKENLDHVFVSAEMGGLTVKFKNGIEQRERTAFSLLPEQIERARQLYESYKVEDVTLWYSGKLTMATVYKPAGIDPNDFLEKGKPLADILIDEFKNEHVKIKHNPDAIDITTPEAGKRAGAQLIYDWLQHIPISVNTRFICFGDNASDYEMARFFGEKCHSVDFVFTGIDISNIEHDKNVNFIKTSKPYNQGAYEYLRDNQEISSS